MTHRQNHQPKSTRSYLTIHVDLSDPENIAHALQQLSDALRFGKSDAKKPVQLSERCDYEVERSHSYTQVRKNRLFWRSVRRLENAIKHGETPTITIYELVAAIGVNPENAPIVLETLNRNFRRRLRARRNREILRLYGDGLQQTDIADQIHRAGYYGSVTNSTVCRVITKAREEAEWVKQRELIRTLTGEAQR